jgi:hypothetical protein
MQLTTLEETKMLLAQTLINQQIAHLPANFMSGGFKVFSQWDDDGLIQYLIRHVNGIPPCFIEFGVENYKESNTRFLLAHDSWKGLILDGSQSNIAQIQADDLYWAHDLTAVHAFITCDNINALFIEHGFSGEVGILSIDIDGNDYWVWQAIDVVRPALVIIEYNSVFGAEHAITIPYEAAFTRTSAHYSNLYFGASLKALTILAAQKGYSLIGSNCAGNNAYFLRADYLARSGLAALDSKQGYVASRFRESVGPDGKPTYLSGAAPLEAIRDCTVYDIELQKQVHIKDLC